MSQALDRAYWDGRWQNGLTGWDIGYPAPSLIKYIDASISNEARVLIPGCGNAWEGEWMHHHGYTNVVLLDLSFHTKDQFLKRVPDFPPDHFLVSDFFQMTGTFDFIIEQTFFCAIDPGQRSDYARQANGLLADRGVLAGLLFNCEFDQPGPPFGGKAEDYRTCFDLYFDTLRFEPAADSIGPRAGRELFVELRKRVASD